MNATIILLNVIFVTLSVIQFGIIVRNAITSTATHTELAKVPLESLEFPLRVSVCVSPGHNQSELEEAGYTKIAKYQQGEGKYKDSIYGWAGHTKDGRSKYSDASILQKKITLWKKLSDI